MINYFLNFPLTYIDAKVIYSLHYFSKKNQHERNTLKINLITNHKNCYEYKLPLLSTYCKNSNFIFSTLPAVHIKNFSRTKRTYRRVFKYLRLKKYIFFTKLTCKSRYFRVSLQAIISEKTTDLWLII